MPTTYVPHTFPHVKPPGRRRRAVRVVEPVEVQADSAVPLVPSVAVPPPRRKRTVRAVQPTRWWPEISNPEIVILGELQRAIAPRFRRARRPNLSQLNVLPLPGVLSICPGTSTVKQLGPGSVLSTSDSVSGFVRGPATVTVKQTGPGAVIVRKCGTLPADSAAAALPLAQVDEGAGPVQVQVDEGAGSVDANVDQG